MPNTFCSNMASDIKSGVQETILFPILWFLTFPFVKTFDWSCWPEKCLLRHADYEWPLPAEADVCATFETDFPMPAPEPPDWAMPKPELEVRLRSNLSEMTEKGRRQTLPSSRRKAKCEGPTSIWDTSTDEVPNEPPVWALAPKVTTFEAETDGTAGSPKLPLRRRSPTSFNFSPSCSAEPGRGCTTNWSGMLTILGMVATKLNPEDFVEQKYSKFSVLIFVLNDKITFKLGKNRL